MAVGKSQVSVRASGTQIMPSSLSDVIATLQNGVQALNNLRVQLSTTFPQATSVSTAVRGTDGTITFNSSLATSFLAVTTSSGAVAYVALYPSS